jgi:hypothetical protein
MGGQLYLVRFAERHFFVKKEAEAETATGCLYLSAATQLSYRAALEIVERLHGLGYTDSVMTNLRGEPITADNVNDSESCDPREVAWFWAEAN